MTILYYTFFSECLAERVFNDKLKLLPIGQTSRIRKFRRWEDAHASLFGKLLLLKGFQEFGVSASLQDHQVQ